MYLCAMTERRPRVYVDFAKVPVGQWKMHDRLENWGRWAHGASGEGPRTAGTSPMFEYFRSSEVQRRRYGEEMSVPIDKDDALKLHFGVIHPEFDARKRTVLQWYYIRGGRHPSGEAGKLKLELYELAAMVIDARQLLIERGV